MSVSNEIIQVLDALAERLGIAVDWTAANVLPYMETLCKKVVNYELATSIAWLSIACIIIVGGVIGIIALCRVIDESDDIVEFVIMIGCTLLGVLTLIMFGVLLSQIFDIVECLTFPEKLVFDEIKSFLTPTN